MKILAKFLEILVKKLYKKFNYNKKVRMTLKDYEDYNDTTICYICGGELKGDKVLDEVHLNGKYTSAAKNECNLRLLSIYQ